MNPTNIVAFLASLGVGYGVLSANPKRSINRAFFFASVNVAAWQMCLAWLNDPDNPDPVYWIRMTSAIGAFIPFLLWIIKESAKDSNFGWGRWGRGFIWMAVAAAMAVLCFTSYFIPENSPRDHPVRGLGWTVFAIVNGGAYVILFLQSVSDLRKTTGIQRIELQTLLFGGAAAGIVAVSLITLGPLLKIPSLPRSLPVDIVAFYSFTAWAITTQKVFDARHLFRTALRWVLSIGAVAAIIAIAMAVDPVLVPRPVTILLCATLIALVYNRFNLRLLRATLMGGDRESDSIRNAILAAGRDEFDRDVLLKRFSKILADWSRTDFAHFLGLTKDDYSSGIVSLPLSNPAVHELQRVKWVTPESLFRQRDAAGRSELSKFMKDHALGVMVFAPTDGGLPSFIVALRARRDRSPYTWSETKALQEWAGIIENMLSRISLTQQARESEQLRTAGLLGASLAHEIRNPLVTLKTIAQSAPARYNDPEFRRLLIDLVPAEIERIEGLVSGLMDLGRPQYPHFERVHLNEIVETSVKLVRPKALDDAVALTCVLEASPDEINGDRASIRQVILNLVMNAIQAVAAMDVDREVNVRTRATGDSVVLEVTDNGPGMPIEIRRRLFQPFTTINKTSGMGLGLAITADLVKLHHGQISLVESHDVGTTFRVTLPCQQPSS
ncbi:MAG TPA: HAMP domain-containing sensor histidine kinase [Opitutaceae bacterium]